MKVLHVIPSYEPAWAFGGTVTATSNLCRAIAKKGLDVSVYTTNADGRGGTLNEPLNEPLNLGGVKVWYFHCNLGRSRGFYSRDLSKKLQETIQFYDLVHVSAIWQWQQVVVSRICTKHRKPYVVTPHNSLSSLSMELDKNIKKKIYWQFWSRHTIRKATALHFLCEGERKSSIDNAFAVPSFIVPNGTNIGLFTKDDRKQLRHDLGFSEQDIVLLSVGRIHPDKRLDLIIKGLGGVSGKKNVKLFFIGPSVDEEYYYSLVKLIDDLNLSSNVILMGSVEHNKINMYYALADLLLLVSKFEGVSMTSIEALSAGLPIIISKGIANWQDIIEEGAGILLDDDPVSISEVLAMITTGKVNLHTLSENARKFAEKRYDIDKVALLMIKAYEDVLTGRRSPELQWQ